jgi:filamentous hemagglutinin
MPRQCHQDVKTAIDSLDNLVVGKERTKEYQDAFDAVALVAMTVPLLKGLGLSVAEVGRRITSWRLGSGGELAATSRDRVLSAISESATARNASAFDVHIARSDQVRSGYFPDEWSMVTLPQGSLLIGGLPGQSAFYAAPSALANASWSRQILFQRLQVAPHPELGYRPRVGVYETTHDMVVPSGRATANPARGVGEETQFFIRDFQQSLQLIREITLRK